jgi:nuclear transport factor 2 (NTF2) superfamily protein
MPPPFPPFDLESAIVKVQAAEDAWNTRDPHRVSLAYTEDSQWRNRDQFVTGRAEIVEFLTAKWDRELDYVLRKSLWGFRENRIAVRFQYEWRDAGGQERSDSGDVTAGQERSDSGDVTGGQERSDSGDVTGGQWFRSYGNELWEFDDQGLMRRREASINDVAIDETARR